MKTSFVKTLAIAAAVLLSYFTLIKPIQDYASEDPTIYTYQRVSETWTETTEAGYRDEKAHSSEVIEEKKVLKHFDWKKYFNGLFRVFGLLSLVGMLWAGAKALWRKFILSAGEEHQTIIFRPATLEINKEKSRMRKSWEEGKYLFKKLWPLSGVMLGMLTFAFILHSVVFVFEYPWAVFNFIDTMLGWKGAIIAGVEKWGAAIALGGGVIALGGVFVLLRLGSKKSVEIFPAASDRKAGKPDNLDSARSKSGEDLPRRVVVRHIKRNSWQDISYQDYPALKEAVELLEPHIKRQHPELLSAFLRIKQMIIEPGHLRAGSTDLIYGAIYSLRPFSKNILYLDSSILNNFFELVLTTLHESGALFGNTHDKNLELEIEWEKYFLGHAKRERSCWQADINELNKLWPSSKRITSIKDAFTLHVALNDEASYEAPTHLFGSKVNIIPYHDGDGVKTAEGTQVWRGDFEISRYFPPNEIGFAINHHRPEYRILSADMAEEEMKEHLKLQDTHIELVIGVQRNGKPGVITLNNPQDYQDGRFGDADYPMIFVKPVYPSYLPNDLKTAYRNNIRTMMAGFNAVSQFPDEYNGGDPLAAYTVEKLKEHLRQMVLAIAAEQPVSEAARDWFNMPENLIYCAELAYVAASAGIHFPLNTSTMVPLVGQKIWNSFKEQIERHNKGEETSFTALNENKFSRLIKLNLAPDDLLSVPQYAPDSERASEASKLAFEPMTMADIVRYALAVHVPREKLGENVASVQAAILKKMIPGLLEAMGMDKLAPTDLRRQAVENLINKIVEVIGRQYDDYSAFQVALEPYLELARNMTGPRPGSETGKGFFVPPSLLHLIAQGKHTGGLLGLEYVGHGLHFSLLKQQRD